MFQFWGNDWPWTWGSSHWLQHQHAWSAVVDEAPEPPLPRRHMRGTNKHRRSRHFRNQMFRFWSDVITECVSLSRFRSVVRKWLVRARQAAERDLESGPSRLPTDTDPENTVDSRVVDAVERAAYRQDSMTAYTSEQQVPLTELEFLALQIMGRHMLSRSGPKDRSQPQAAIAAEARPKSRARRGNPSKLRLRGKTKANPAVRSIVPVIDEESSDGADEDVADVAIVAQVVVDAMPEAPTCRICLCEADGDADGDMSMEMVAQFVASL